MKLSVRFISLCVLLSIARLGAQSYCPMPDTNAYWKEAMLFFSSSNSTSTQQDEFLEGDTVIGSYTYKKVYSYGTSTYNPSGNVSSWTHSYLGAMRDDTVNRKVYFIPQYPANGPEYLLYDFTLTVGQALPFTWQHYQDSMWVTSIDSVYFNSRYHRRYHTGNMGCGDEYEWVEGMGSSYGLTLPFSCSAQLSRMLCFYENNRPCWPDTVNGCASAVGMTDNVVSHELKIYPVPAHGLLHIEVPAGKQEERINIYNGVGQLMMERVVNSAAPIEINLSSFARGIYLLNYSASDGYVEMKKFVVE